MKALALASVFSLLWLLPAAGFAAAREIVVDCNAGKTITWGLSKLDPAGPSVLKVSGVCRENVLIRGFSDLRLAGTGGAELFAAPAGPATDDWGALSVMAVVESSLVTIKGLTIHAPGATGVAFTGCRQCLVKNSAIDSSGAGGSAAFIVAHNSDVRVSAVRVRDLMGSWTSDSSALHVEGSDFDGGNLGWAAIMTGPGGVASVEGSTFRHFGVGIHAIGGSTVRAEAWTTVNRGSSAPTIIEENSCGGIWVDTRAIFTISSPASVRVVDNGSPGCGGGAVRVSSGGLANLASLEVTNNHDAGIEVIEQGLAMLGSDIRVSGNLWSGLVIQNGSLAVGSGGGDPSHDVYVSGNGGPGGTDLLCDGSSRITGKGHFAGTPTVSCPGGADTNFEP